MLIGTYLHQKILICPVLSYLLLSFHDLTCWRRCVPISGLAGFTDDNSLLSCPVMPYPVMLCTVQRAAAIATYKTGKGVYCWALYCLVLFFYFLLGYVIRLCCVIGMEGNLFCCVLFNDIIC
nr:MAG TPA: hypothetical protein [Bacteriophage sp.]